MANITSAGTIYVDTANQSVYSGRVKISYIVLTSDSSHAYVNIHDGSSISDPKKLTLKVGASHDTKIFDFSAKPLVFQHGIFVDGLSTNCILMLLTTTGGNE